MDTVGNRIRTKRKELGFSQWRLAELGVIVILFNWMLGGIALIIAILIAIVGKKKQTVLSCPSCGQDAKVLG